MMSYMKTMKLVFLLMITLFSSNALTFSYANATEQIDFITFTQLDRVDQRRLVSTMQILAANLEEEQLGPIRRKNKYKTVQNILNYLLQDAYAENDPIRPAKHEKLCIYAGWISYRVAGKCRHPNGISKEDGPYKSGMLAPHTDFLDSQKTTYGELITKVDGKGFEGCDPADGQERMICNPKLFGTRLDGTPFCSVGNKDSYNSSFGCIQNIKKYAQKVADERTEEGKENNTLEAVKGEILDGIISKGVEGPQEDLDSLSNMLQLNYDICMCKGGQGYINQKYAEDMYNQRTCYAWLYQTKDIISRMKTKTCTKFEGFTYQKSKANEKETLMSMMDWANKAYDVINKNILEDSKMSENFFEYGNYGSNSHNDQRWLDNRPVMDDSSCPISASESIKAKIADGDKEKYKLVTGYIVALPGESGEKELDSNIEGWIFSGKADGKDGEIVLHETDKNKAYYPCYEDVEYKATVKLESLDKSVDITIGKCQEPIVTELACTITIDDKRTKEVQKESTENIESTENANAAEELVLLTVSVSKQDGLEEDFDITKAQSITWTNATQLDDLAQAKFVETKQEERKVSVEVVLSADKKAVCSEDISKHEPTIVDPDKPKYTIELAQEDGDDNKVKVTATVKKDDEVVEDLSTDKLTIDWSSLVKGKDHGEDKDGTPNVDADEITNIEEGSTSLVVEVVKKETKKTITAVLKKEDEKQDEASEEIAAIESNNKTDDDTGNDKNVADDGGLNNNPAKRTPSSKRKLQKAKGGFFGNR
jgi:hypothetical protein